MQMDMGVPQIREEYSYFKRLSKSPNIDDSEAFQYEYRRTASFANWPEGNDIDLLHTAKAGLYYRGVENRIACFSCGVSFNAPSQSDDPVKIHKNRSPTCPLLSHTDTLNKPLWVSDDEGSDVDDSPDSIPELGAESNAVASLSTPVLGDTPTVAGSSSHSDLPDLTQSTPVNFDASSQPDQSQGAATENVCSTVVSPPLASLPGETQVASGEFTRRSVSPRAVSLPANTPSILRDQDTLPSANSDIPSVGCGLELGRRASSEEPSPTMNMFSEETRLRSFANWPASAKVRATDLARLGFFYMGQQDKTQCAFCHRVLMKWEEGDDIQGEHRKYSETCLFLTGTETQNIPMQTQRTHAAQFRNNVGRQGAQAMQRSQGAVTLTRRPMTSESQATRAMHPEYADYNQRLASFQQNREWCSTNVSAQSLADAGFYFAGFGDNVRCHFCDGGLRNWEKDDDPWVEHARWFTRCGYLLAKKGTSFINDVRQRYPVSSATQGEEVQEAVEQPDPLHDIPLNVKFRKEAREMGFMDDQIREAVEKEQATKGHTFLDMQSLVNALLALMPEEAEQATGETCTAHRQPSPSNTRERDDGDKDKVTSNQVKPKKNKKKKKKGSANGDNQQQASQNAPTTVLIPEDDDESRSLQEENRQLKEQRMCKVCMDEEVNIVFLPCGHLVACANCAPALRACPICRALIRGSLRTYLS